MTARAEAEKAIAAVLLDHQINILNSRGVECLCGWYLASEPTDTYEGLVAERYIRQHLASVLNDLMADAWDEGAKTLDEFHHHRRKVPGPMPPPNPYRVTDTEGDR